MKTVIGDPFAAALFIVSASLAAGVGIGIALLLSPVRDGDATGVSSLGSADDGGDVCCAVAAAAGTSDTGVFAADASGALGAAGAAIAAGAAFATVSGGGSLWTNRCPSAMSDGFSSGREMITRTPILVRRYRRAAKSCGMR